MYLDNEDVLKLLRKPARYLFKGNEKEFENYILENIDDIVERLGYAPIDYWEQQHVIQLNSYKIIPDIMIWHKDGTGTVFEVKVTNEKNSITSPNAQIKAIGQLLLYRSVIKNRYGAAPRVFMVTDQLFEKTLHVFSDNNIPVGLIEIQNDKVFLAKS